MALPTDNARLPGIAHSNLNQLPSTGFVRIASILAPTGPIPVGRSTWWAGVKDGRFPQPVKLGPRITAWRVEDIRALIADGALRRPDLAH